MQMGEGERERERKGERRGGEGKKQSGGGKTGRERLLIWIV